jgi:hypothetical protein
LLVIVILLMLFIYAVFWHGSILFGVSCHRDKWMNML